MAPIITQYFKSPVGELVLGAFGNELVLCDWRYRRMRTAIDKRIQESLAAEYQEGHDPVLAQTITQLEEYFANTRTDFDLPFRLVGSAFQQQVWQALLGIGYGQTSTYLDLSKKLGNPKAIRAVASANGANAISIIVPCHRIIGSDGDLVGYAGGLKAKEKLLRLEGAAIFRQVELF